MQPRGSPYSIPSSLANPPPQVNQGYPSGYGNQRPNGGYGNQRAPSFNTLSHMQSFPMPQFQPTRDHNPSMPPSMSGFPSSSMPPSLYNPITSQPPPTMHFPSSRQPHSSSPSNQYPAATNNQPSPSFSSPFPSWSSPNSIPSPTTPNYGMKQMSAEETHRFHQQRQGGAETYKKLEEEQIQKKVQERLDQIERERVESEKLKEKEFEQKWKEREAQWKVMEQERVEKRMAEEKLAREKRAMEEHKMMEEARKQAKEKTAIQMKEEYEKRRKQEIQEMKLREQELLDILEKERKERNERERELTEKQKQREIQTQIEEQQRLQEALERFRLDERAQMEEQFMNQKESEIRSQMEKTFQEEANTRKIIFEQEKQQMNQQNELFDCNWLIESSELDMGSQIGQGAFGEVFRGKLHGKEVAIKKLLVQTVDGSSLEEFKREISIMSNLRHPNLLLFIGACLDPNNLALVTEFMPMGSLQDVLFVQNITLDIKKRLTILKEIAQGMAWLHSLKPPFLHRDLKTGNILLDKNWSVRISDFGLSSVKCLDESGQPQEGPIGSPFYMAPEILLDKPYDMKADVYSYSIVIWETLAHKDPYEGEFESYEEMVEGITMDGMRPTIPEWFPVGVVALLNRCWDTDPDQRPTFGQILQQSWFDHILVDFCIPKELAPLASVFWKTHFLDQCEVSVEEFLKALSLFCGIVYDDRNPVLRLWKTVVARRASSSGLLMVNISEFADAVLWYGPMEKKSDLLNKLVDTSRYPWFHGLSRQALGGLSQQAPGTWFISQVEIVDKKHRKYVISYLDKQSGKVLQVTFYQDLKGNFHFNSKVFPLWDLLLREFQTCLAIDITKPAPGSPFTPLFK